MTCATETLNVRHTIQETHKDNQLSRKEFIRDVLHLKCKVINLVQDQMKESYGKWKLHYQKGNQRSITESTVTRYSSKSTGTNALAKPTKFLSTSTEDNNFPNTKHVPYVQNLPPERRMNNITWRNSMSRLIPRCSNILLAALILGILVWMSLLYGALLGASLCGHGRSSFPLMSFAHSQTRNILF